MLSLLKQLFAISRHPDFKNFESLVSDVLLSKTKKQAFIFKAHGSIWFKLKLIYYDRGKKPY